MVRLTVDATEVIEGLGHVTGALEDREPIHAIMADVLYDNTIERFKSEQTPDGDAWAAHSPITVLLRGHGAAKLRATGELFGSIHSSSNADGAEVGTNLDHPKVWVHQHGATIKPRRASVLRIPRAPGANAPIFLKKAEIPARTYIGLGPNDGDEVLEAVIAYLDPG